MKLSQILIEATPPAHTAAAMLELERLFPGVRVILSSGDLVISPKNELDGWKLIETLTKRSREDIMQQVNNDIKISHENDHQHGGISQVTSFVVGRKLISQIIEAGLQRLLSYLPAGWNLKTYNLKFPKGIDHPRFTITFAKNKYNKVEARGKRWFHITLASNIDNIKQNGLTPTSSSKGLVYGTYKNRTYLLSSYVMEHKLDTVKRLSKKLQASIQPYDDQQVEYPDYFQPIAILEVNVPKNIEIYTDDSSEDVGGAYIKKPIPPENLKLVYTGDIDDMKIH